MGQRDRCPSRNGASHHVRNHVGGIQQRLALEMGVALSGLRLGMAQQVLHLVQGAPAVDEDRRERVPQIVDAHILSNRIQTRPPFRVQKRPP